MPEEQWDLHAGWWQTHFTAGADPEYEEQILPLVAERLGDARRVVDIGCGEGQVARRLAGPGVTVVGVDPSVRQLVVAQRRGGGPCYAVGRADAIPLRAASVDLAVVCLVLEHVDDLDGAVAEMARVVCPGGRLLLLLNHPLLQTPDSGWIDDHTVDPPEQYWRLGPYLPEAATMEEVARGVVIRFLHRPLGRYLAALRRAGFVLDEFLEPAPPAGFLAQAPEYQAAATIPRLLLLHLRRQPS